MSDERHRLTLDRNGLVTSPGPNPAGRCTIYDDRPEVCRMFPTLWDWRPLDCTYRFDDDGDRAGECDSSVCGAQACCNFPRVGGEPTALFSPRDGLPCKHLIGLEGAAARVEQMNRCALWVGELHVARRDERTWSIGRVELGRVSNVVWSVVIPNDKLWERLVDGEMHFALKVPGTENRLEVHLSARHIEAMRQLRPA